jgi:uncharacterized protein (DUF1684 family)
MTRETLEAHRAERHRQFKEGLTSPLTPEQQRAFTGLEYYDYNPDLDLTVTVRRCTSDETIVVHTTKNETKEFKRYGEFSFTVEGQPVQLTLYHAPFGFFVPFIDSQAGQETYPAGRYVDPEQIDSETFHVDFNGAYNPLCAYNDLWNCPVTPDENRLALALRAGERMPRGPWVDH